MSELERLIDSWEAMSLPGTGLVRSYVDQSMRRISELEEDRDRILTKAARAFAIHGFDIEYHNGEPFVVRNGRAMHITDGAAERLRGWLSGEPG